MRVTLITMRSLFLIAALLLVVPYLGACNADGITTETREVLTATTQTAGTVASVTPPGSIAHEIALGLTAVAGVMIAFEQSWRRARESRRKREALEKLADANLKLTPPGEGESP